MNTTTLTIDLNESSRKFIEEQTTRGGFSSVSDYIQALVEAEEKRQAQERLETQLLQGLRSELAPLTADEWEAIRQEGLHRLATRKVSP
jgi:antitoxin ParD1/3/4